MIVRHFGACFAVEMRASSLRRERLDLEIEGVVRSGGATGRDS